MTFYLETLVQKISNGSLLIRLKDFKKLDRFALSPILIKVLEC